MEVEKNNNKSIVCPRCKQKLISTNQVCINCGYDLSNENKVEEEKLSFGLETPTTIIKINKNEKTISQIETKPIYITKVIKTILVLLTSLLGICFLIVPLFSENNVFAYTEAITKYYDFSGINDNLVINDTTCYISLVKNLSAYYLNFNHIMDASFIFSIYEILIIILVAVIVITSSILFVKALINLSLNKNYYYKGSVGLILSVSLILIFALDCGGVGLYTLSLLAVFYLLTIYVFEIITHEKKFILKNLIHKSISFVLLLALLITSTIGLTNLDIANGANLYNMELNKYSELGKMSCKGLFLEMIQYVQCTSGDDYFTKISLTINLLCLIFQTIYLVCIVLSLENILKGLSKQNLRFPIKKIIVSAVAYYAFAISLFVINKMVNDASLQDYVNSIGQVAYGKFSNEEVIYAKNSTKVYTFSVAYYICGICYLPIMIYTIIAKNYCLKKSY
ncbi:MAG: hypothetical protein SOU19_05005 [Candidatus Caccosoma sp.]|nr:hypothetical protein [Candidatus Caccosoma sp.]